jgi:hypothetical protein
MARFETCSDVRSSVAFGKRGQPISVAIGANRKLDARSPTVPTPGQIFGSSVQPEKACDKENDDDDADDVKNVHGVLRWRHRDFSMKSATSN